MYDNNWQQAFDKIQSLNAVQSAVLPYLIQSRSNLLVCAPTGAGKTIIALLAILQELLKNNVISTNNKVVYLAPMKALASEVVGGLTARLKPLQISVCEFTGDQHLSSEELEKTNVIVSTPEKWDILSRKSLERPIVDQLTLLIIDEVHLLGDSRGGIIESIAYRAMQSSFTRIIGLSATLPNPKDVGSFLKVPEDGLFLFGSEYRPIPLSLKLMGISEKGKLKQAEKINELLFMIKLSHRLIF